MNNKSRIVGEKNMKKFMTGKELWDLFAKENNIEKNNSAIEEINHIKEDNNI